jgi:hypothetical protein
VVASECLFADLLAYRREVGEQRRDNPCQEDNGDEYGNGIAMNTSKHPHLTYFLQTRATPAHFLSETFSENADPLVDAARNREPAPSAH